jgi:hypothetical protein
MDMQFSGKTAFVGGSTDGGVLRSAVQGAAATATKRINPRPGGGGAFAVAGGFAGGVFGAGLGLVYLIDMGLLGAGLGAAAGLTLGAITPLLAR